MTNRYDHALDSTFIVSNKKQKTNRMRELIFKYIYKYVHVIVKKNRDVLLNQEILTSFFMNLIFNKNKL